MAAALPYAARRLLSGRARQSIYAAAFSEDKRRLSQTSIHSGSSGYSRRFYSNQSDQPDPLTFEEKMKIYKRGTHLFFRASKAVSTIVACGIAIKLSVDELFCRGYLWHQITYIIDSYHDVALKDNPRKINSVLNEEALLEAKLAELKCMLKDATPESLEQLVDVESNE